MENFVRIRSLNKAKHFAVHRTFIKRYPDGTEKNVNIDKNIKDILIKSIEKRGITEGFILKFDENDNYYEFEENKIQPENISIKLV